ncbi:armadillo-like helical domain-containing protein [Cavenderia fasciculata]|uniref:Armadillo-like helical domain-containing protein n=1 Tax=Cavenderia fasciculata TaxID=261658 RepID=F4Q7P1_CACFS|nr:armadillo-like helical domain-containing protein [Cavenderia fasciculata]EGG15791.1 armadillo-like helical domain-containing protein [Cavenderia fasciculata]|eukprot:XP_004352116.1 armadillo-like helical domain-containing protein [Cavenderia fasciculata]
MNTNEIDQIINQITSSLSQLHDPRSTQEQRQSSQVFLEELKTRPNAYTFALKLVQTPQINDIAKHYGLHVIENLVKNRWNQASDSEKESVKKEILQIVANISPKEQRFIKEKMVTVIVEIVKRDWPQRWSNLLESLVQISQLGDSQAELVLLTFGKLPSEIIVEGGSGTTSSAASSSLPDQRKKDLMIGINLAVESLFNYFYQVLESRYQLYKQQSQNQPNINIISTLLNCLISYIDWIPLKTILQHKLDFIFCQLLQDLPFRINSCECLLLFSNRKCKIEEKGDLLSTFNMLETIHKAMGVTSNSFEDDYVFQKRMAQMLTILGTTHLSYYSSIREQDRKLPNNYQSFLQMMLQLLQHPSVLMTSLSIPFWNAFLKNQDIIKPIDYMDSLLKELLVCSQSKILKVGDPDKQDQTIQSKYSSIDFGTSKEWGQFFGTVRSRFIDLTKLISNLSPEIAIEFIIKKSIEMIPAIKSTTLALTHEQTLILESISFYLEVVVQNLPALFFQVDSKYQSSIKLTEQLLQELFQNDFKDANATSFQIDCIRPFTSYYSHHGSSLQFILKKLVPLIAFKNPTLDQPKMTVSTQHCRRRAISSLIHLATELTDQMKPFLNDLYQSIIQLFQMELLLDSEKVMLFHLLMIFANEYNNYQQSLGFLKEFIQPVLNNWVSLDFTNAFKSPENLVNFLGLDKENNYSTEYIGRRKKLQFTIASLQIFWKKAQLPSQVINATAGESSQGFMEFISNGISYPSKWPISEFIKDILPNLASLVATLHQLWNPSFIQSIPACYHPIFQLDEAITAPLLGQDYHKDNKNESENIKFLRNLIDLLREACYEIIGYGFSHSDELFEISTLPKILFDSIFSSLEFCENRHLKLLLRHCLIFLVKYNPPKLQSQTLQPLLPPFITLLFNKIKLGWEEIEIRSQKINNHSEMVEIVDDKILRDLTLEFTYWIKDFSSHPSILSDLEIMTPVIYGLSACLLSNDHQIVIKSTPISVHLIEIIGEDARFHHLLGNEMFGVCLKMLIRNKTPDLASDFINIVRAIYHKLYKHTNVCHQLLLQIPNITPQHLNKFDKDLSYSKSEKNQKALFKTFLNDIIGININKLKKPSILDLPEKLFVAKQTGTPSWNDIPHSANTIGTTLTDLFD